jgi:hypothetical protein
MMTNQYAMERGGWRTPKDDQHERLYAIYDVYSHAYYCHIGYRIYIARVGFVSFLHVARAQQQQQQQKKRNPTQIHSAGGSSQHSGMRQECSNAHFDIPIVVFSYSIAMRIAGRRRVVDTADPQRFGGITDLGRCIRIDVLDLVLGIWPLELSHNIQVGLARLVSKTSPPTEVSCSVNERERVGLFSET